MTDASQVFEQFGTMVENEAITIGQYYRKLLAEGLPVDLAYELTLQFADHFWRKTFGILDSGLTNSEG